MNITLEYIDENGQISEVEMLIPGAADIFEATIEIDNLGPFMTDVDGNEISIGYDRVVGIYLSG